MFFHLWDPFKPLNDSPMKTLICFVNSPLKTLCKGRTQGTNAGAHPSPFLRA